MLTGAVRSAQRKDSGNGNGKHIRQNQRKFQTCVKYVRKDLLKSKDYVPGATVGNGHTTKILMYAMYLDAPKKHAVCGFVYIITRDGTN